MCVPTWEVFAIYTFFCLHCVLTSPVVDQTYAPEESLVTESQLKRREILLPPLPADSPYPVLLHERDVIRYTGLRQQFLRIGGGAHADISLAEIRGRPFNQLAIVKSFKGASFSTIMKEARIHRYVEQLGVTPRLIGLLTSGKNSTNTSLVYEYIPFSNNLHDWMTPELKVTFSKSQWIDIALQIIDVIRLVHSYDVIFNDLHRGNILIEKVGSQYKVFIIDFGLATFKNGKFYNDYYGSLQGYTFIAPEVKYDRMSSKMSDIHSLGIIFKKMKKKLGLRKLLQLGKWCSFFEPEGRPDLNFIELKLKDLLLEYWLVSVANSRPTYSTIPLYHKHNVFNGKLNDFKICPRQYLKGKGLNTGTTKDTKLNLNSKLEESPVWGWLVENNNEVFDRCPTDIFVLDYLEVMPREKSDATVFQSSQSQSIYLTRLESNNRTVIVKAFHQLDFAIIRQETCVTALLGKHGVTPEVLGLLPGKWLLDDSGFVQEYYGAGITLARYYQRVKYVAWNRRLLMRAATELSFNDNPRNGRLLNACSRFSYLKDFWELIKCGFRNSKCHAKSLKERVFTKVAYLLTEAVKTVHDLGYLVNNLVEHNVLVRWNGTTNRLDVKLVDLNRVTSLSGARMTHEPRYLSSFPFLAPEVVMGESSSVKSDIFSLCHVLNWLLVDLISINDRKLRAVYHKASVVDAKRCQHNRANHWSKTIPDNQLHSCNLNRYSNLESGSHIFELFAWQRLGTMLSRCLENSTEARPTTEHILNTINSILL